MNRLMMTIKIEEYTQDFNDKPEELADSTELTKMGWAEFDHQEIDFAMDTLFAYLKVNYREDNILECMREWIEGKEV